MKATAGRRSAEVRRFASHLVQFFPFVQFDVGHRTQQAIGVRVQRLIEDFRHVSDLGDLPGVHHHNPVGDLGDERDVVRDHQDGQVELVGGAFDIEPRKSKQMGKELNLDPKRVYKNYGELIEKELQLPTGERMDFVTICAPNNWHFPIAKDLLERDLNNLQISADKRGRYNSG